MVEIRLCADEADEQLSLEIHNAVWPLDAVTMEEMRSFRAETVAWADHLVLVDGASVGSAVVAIRSQRPALPFTLLTVLPANRRRGAGSALYRAVSRWVAARGLHELEAIAAEDDVESLHFAAKRGFRETDRNGRLALELAEVDPRAVDPPAGVAIATWAERPDAARGLYDVYREAMPDIPGQADDEVESFEDWLRHQMSGSGDRADATFVALAGEEVVGYAKFSFTRAQPDLAFHDLTGVRRAWRGRGVAGALKRAQIAWAKEQGFARLQTQNEIRNQPIRRLNERLGYRPLPGRVFLRGPLAAADA